MGGGSCRHGRRLWAPGGWLATSEADCWGMDQAQSGAPRRGGVVSVEQTKKVKGREPSSDVLTKLQTVHFDQFEHEEHELPQLVVDFFAKWNLFEEFKVPVPVFHNFVDGARN